MISTSYSILKGGCVLANDEICLMIPDSLLPFGRLLQPLLTTVLHPMDLWPFWKASLIAAAACCLWHFNCLWALALPLTSVTGINMQI